MLVTYALLVGMQYGTASMENSTAVPQHIEAKMLI